MGLPDQADVRILQPLHTHTHIPLGIQFSLLTLLGAR